MIEHAWCATFSGQVIDPNLSGQSAAAYLGVAFTMSFRRTALARTGGTQPILIADPVGNPTPNLDILKHGLNPETILEIGKPYSYLHATRSDASQEWPQWPAPDAAEHERSSGTPGTPGTHSRQRLASAA